MEFQKRASGISNRKAWKSQGLDALEVGRAVEQSQEKKEVRKLEDKRAPIDELVALLRARRIAPTMLSVIDSAGDYFAVAVGDARDAPAAFPLSIDFDPDDDQLSIGPLSPVSKLRAHGEWQLDDLPANLSAMAFACCWIEASVAGRLALARGLWSAEALVFGSYGVFDTENVETVSYGFNPARPFEVVRRFAPLGQ